MPRFSRSRFGWVTVLGWSMLAVASTSAGQGGTDADWDLVFSTDAVTRIGDYRLPPGEYWLEQESIDATVFVLYDDDDPARANPIAMVDAWIIPTSDPGIAESNVRVLYDPEDRGLPVIEGWTIEGQRWKVRDVVSADGSDVLTQIFSD